MAEPRITAALAAAPLFAGLAPREVAHVASFCRYRDFAKGTVLFRQGDDADAFFVVVAGQIKVFKTSADGREIILKVMRKGDLAGEAAALVAKVYPATAEALDDAAAVEVPQRAFVSLVEDEPALALNMIAALSERLRHVSNVVEKLTLQDVPARLASYLLAHADGPPGRRQVELQIAKGTLAAELGTVPETLSRALRKLADAGVITLKGRRVAITDERSLAFLAGGAAP